MGNTRLVLRDRIKRGLRGTVSDVWTDDEVNDAINFAIHSAYPDWFIVKQGTSNTVAANTFIYTLDSDCKHVLQVWKYEESTEPYSVIRNWRESESTATTGSVTKYLYLDNANEYDAGDTLKVVYLAEPAELSNDTDTTVVPDDYIIPRAKMYLLEMEMRSAPAQDVDAIRSLMQWNQQIADDVRSRKGMALPPSHVHWTDAEANVDLFSIPGVIDNYRGA